MESGCWEKAYAKGLQMLESNEGNIATETFVGVSTKAIKGKKEREDVHCWVKISRIAATK